MFYRARLSREHSRVATGGRAFSKEPSESYPALRFDGVRYVADASTNVSQRSECVFVVGCHRLDAPQPEQTSQRESERPGPTTPSILGASRVTRASTAPHSPCQPNTASDWTLNPIPDSLPPTLPMPAPSSTPASAHRRVASRRRVERHQNRYRAARDQGARRAPARDPANTPRPPRRLRTTGAANEPRSRPRAGSTCLTTVAAEFPRRN